MSESAVRGAVRFCLERECVREGRVGVPGCDESKSKSMSSRECKWVVSDRACKDVDVDGWQWQRQAARHITTIHYAALYKNRLLVAAI